MKDASQHIDNIDHMNMCERNMKRMGDIIGSLVGLVILSPLFVIIYILLKFDSKGPAIFSQERIGKGGKPFLIYKFRTMIVQSEQNGPALAKKNDKRLTRVGRVLRAYHLDELPQLWNVLKGDMSLVGYRPERKYYIDKIMEINPDYALLYCSRPGVTSDATLHNGYTDTMEKMLRRLQMDLDYLRNRSLLTDLKIIIETIFCFGSTRR